MLISSLYFNYSSKNLYVRNKNASNSAFNSTKLKDELQNTLSKSDKHPSALSKEQKDYLNGKYDIDNMIFSIDKNLSGDTEEFMKDLYEMGIISEKELNNYSSPGRYALKPANYDSLPEDLQKQFIDDPLVQPNGEQTYTSYILAQDVSGENIKDAFQVLAIQQKRQAALSLGQNDKEKFMEYSNMYKKLSGILEEIFG